MIGIWIIILCGITNYNNYNKKDYIKLNKYKIEMPWLSTYKSQERRDEPMLPGLF